MVDQILSKNLRSLDAIAHCIETPIDPAQHVVLRTISSAISTVFLVIKRSYFFITHFTWFDNKTAKKIVTYYTFKAAAEEKTSERTEKIKKNF